ncbi:MAG: ribonuclease III [Bryobacteraceae bacterium]
MRAEPASLELKIDYQFVHAELLRRALTHSSLANESHPGASSPLNDNEQLEFLGDSVLGFLVAEALVRRFPESREGELSQLKAHLVCATHLHGVARRLDLGSYLELGRSEEMTGGRAKKTLLVDALEALIAAIFLDGGLEAARSFVTAHVLTNIQPAIVNFKNALEQLTQARKLPQPRYSIAREQGPEHSKTFTVEVRVGEDFAGQADGHTKKLAAQRAARAVYERLRQEASPESPSAEPHAGAGSPA